MSVVNISHFIHICTPLSIKKKKINSNLLIFYFIFGENKFYFI